MNEIIISVLRSAECYTSTVEVISLLQCLTTLAWSLQIYEVISKEMKTLLIGLYGFQLNYPIQWSNGKSFDKNFFDLQLEDAMPKLESQKSRRCSTSSSSQSAGTCMQMTGYQRCISTNTQVSELGISNTVRPR